MMLELGEGVVARILVALTMTFVDVIGLLTRRLPLLLVLDLLRAMHDVFAHAAHHQSLSLLDLFCCGSLGHSL